MPLRGGFALCSANAEPLPMRELPRPVKRKGSVSVTHRPVAPPALEPSAQSRSVEIAIGVEPSPCAPSDHVQIRIEGVNGFSFFYLSRAQAERVMRERES